MIFEILPTWKCCSQSCWLVGTGTIRDYVCHPYQAIHPPPNSVWYVTGLRKHCWMLDEGMILIPCTQEELGMICPSTWLSSLACPERSDKSILISLNTSVHICY